MHRPCGKEKVFSNRFSNPLCMYTVPKLSLFLPPSAVKYLNPFYFACPAELGLKEAGKKLWDVAQIT